MLCIMINFCFIFFVGDHVSLPYVIARRTYWRCVCTYTFELILSMLWSHKSVSRCVHCRADFHQHVSPAAQTSYLCSSRTINGFFWGRHVKKSWKLAHWLECVITHWENARYARPWAALCTIKDRAPNVTSVPKQGGWGQSVIEFSTVGTRGDGRLQSLCQLAWYFTRVPLNNPVVVRDHCRHAVCMVGDTRIKFAQRWPQWETDFWFHTS